jgi:UDP-N-acetyl-D-mannosaminuronate dehydrogenase
MSVDFKTSGETHTKTWRKTVTNEILVIGMGEIGKPLFEIINEKYPVTGVDAQPVEFKGTCAVMHICFPFDSARPDKFTGECKRYIQKYKPGLTVINSTVAPLTTRRIQEETGARVVNSPVRGKHAKMRQELLHYTKFIGGTDPDACRDAESHFQSLGMKTKVLASPEATEIAKLSETTYFGVLIAWAQEVERYCDRFGTDYDEVVGFYNEIAYLPPVKFTPGSIGGHCVMPNIGILRKSFDSALLDAIRISNEHKAARDASKKLPPK